MKKKIIDQIRKLVLKYDGVISTGEMQTESSPCYGSLGDNITALAEEFNTDKAYIIIYDCRTGDEVDDFYKPYEELTISLLKQILKVLQDYTPEEKE